MPDPKSCAAKFKVGSKEYNDCVNYKGSYANKSKASPVKGSVKKSAGGGY